MARIRSIKPEFWKSEAIACHDFFTRLVFIGLWTYVDDNGVGLDNAKLVAAELFPLEDDFAKVSRDLREALARLADAGRIARYTVGGKAYLAIANWEEHQKIDRPAKARYPSPDDPRATPTPPPTRENANPRETLDESSRDRRETVAQPHRLDQGSGIRDQGIREQGTGALAPLGASVPEPVIDAEIVDHPGSPVTLFVVPDPPATDLAVPEPSNAGQVLRQWIEFCTRNDLKLTNNAIKRYGRHIKDALGQGFTIDLIKRALSEMLRDRVVSRPSLFDNYLVRAQQGPELPPRRTTRAEEAAARLAPQGLTPEQHLHDTLTRLA